MAIKLVKRFFYQNYTYFSLSFILPPIHFKCLISLLGDKRHFKGVFGMGRENVRERELIKRGKGKGKGYGYMLFGITM